MKSQNYKDLLWELIKTNFKIRYNNSILGFVWVLIKPFAMFAILYTVWSALGRNSENYQVRLLLGIILFTFVNEAIIFGMNGLLDKAHIILKVNFPREIAVMSSVAMAVINLSINLIVYLVFSLFNPVTPSLVGIGWGFVAIFVSSILIYGVTLFLSIMLIRLRDLQHIFELVFQLLFWGTPIFYTLGEEIPFEHTIGKVISLNPLGWLIETIRQGFIYGEIATLRIWIYDISSLWVILLTFVVGIITVMLGRMYFRKEVKKVAEFF